MTVYCREQNNAFPHSIVRGGVFMCRKYLVMAAAAAGFGCGFVLSILIESYFLRLLAGGGLIFLGFVLAGRK